MARVRPGPEVRFAGASAWWVWNIDVEPMMISDGPRLFAAQEASMVCTNG